MYNGKWALLFHAKRQWTAFAFISSKEHTVHCSAVVKRTSKSASCKRTVGSLKVQTMKYLFSCDDLVTISYAIQVVLIEKIATIIR